MTDHSIDHGSRADHIEQYKAYLQDVGNIGAHNSGVRSLLLLSSKERGRMGLCRDLCGSNLLGRFTM